MEWRALATDLILIASVILALGGAVTLVFRGLRNLRDGFAGQVIEIVDQRVGEAVAKEMAPSVRQLDEIKRNTEELVPNGGASMKDTIHRVEDKLSNLTDRTDHEHAEIWKALKSLGIDRRRSQE